MPTVFLGKGRDKSLIRKHPWIFESAISRIEGRPQRGDTVEVVSPTGEWLARGAFSPQSQIRIRVWSFDEQEQVDAGFFHRRIEQAIAARALGPDDNTCRVVFSESDGLPGLIVDRYDRFYVVQFLTAGAERWRDAIVGALQDIVHPDGIYERSDVDVRDREGLKHRTGVLAGHEPPEKIEVRENGTRFLVDIRQGHKTGFYLDQRENRKMLRQYASGKSVLNCFSYTGGFGVSAARCGASHVVNVDSSPAALELARENFELNGLDLSRAEFVQADVFKLLRTYRDEGKQFDIVVMDPPKFVENKHQLMQASRGYKDVNLLAFRLLRPGGLLFTFSCSGLMETALFQKIVADAALDAARPAQIISRLYQASDHPTLLSFPEAMYLKGFICRVSGQ